MEPEVRDRFEANERVAEHLITAVRGLVEGMKTFQESLLTLRDQFEQYAKASNARLTRIEENLDALIRAISTDHKNGGSAQ